MQKKVYIIFTIIFAIILLYLMMPDNNDDIAIYTHYDSSFSFAICDVDSENELVIKIIEYGWRDLFSFSEDQPESRDVLYTIITIPEKYHVSKDNIVLYNGYLHKQISPGENEQYALTNKKIDYYVYGNRKCFPSIIELRNGEKLLIYKSSRKLYITEI